MAYAAEAAQFMQLGLGGFSWRSVLSLVPGIWEAPSIRDFLGARGGAARYGNRRSVLSLVPWIREDPSVRDFLRWEGVEGRPIMAPGVRPYTFLFNISLYIYRIFFTYSSVDGHLGCVHILVVVNSTMVNFGVHIFSC